MQLILLQKKKKEQNDYFSLFNGIILDNYIL